MKIKELIEQLQEIENKEKYIHLLGNEINGEDESTDITFDILEIWDDGDESITLFLTNNKIVTEVTGERNRLSCESKLKKTADEMIESIKNINYKN